jgi:hypothetical protein
MACRQGERWGRTLGHANIATTSQYLHARPGDSSGRYLAE